MSRAIVTGFILLLNFILAGIAYNQEAPQKNVITMGRVTEKVFKLQKDIEPIITYLASRLRDVGIERGEVVPVSNNKTIIRYLREGKIDIVLETPFSAQTYRAGANVTPILLVWRKGEGEYNSFIFARKDSGINRLEDLKGRIIAFEDEGSTSAYFLPKFSMEAKGLNLTKISYADPCVPKDVVGYVFAGSELNISSWVFFKKEGAGVLSCSDWFDQRDNPRAYRKEFKIIYKTQKLPRMLVMVRAGLDERFVARVKEELLNMDKSKEGKEALNEFDIKKFVALPKGALRRIEHLYGEKARILD